MSGRVIFNAVADPTVDASGSIPAAAAPVAFTGNGTTETRNYTGQSGNGMSCAFVYLSGGGDPGSVTVLFQRRATSDADSWVDVAQITDADGLGGAGYQKTGVYPNGVYRAVVSGSVVALFIGIEGV